MGGDHCQAQAGQGQDGGAVQVPPGVGVDEPEHAFAEAGGAWLGGGHLDEQQGVFLGGQERADGDQPGRRRERPSAPQSGRHHHRGNQYPLDRQCGDDRSQGHGCLLGAEPELSMGRVGAGHLFR
jgi:hypothetical protein